MMTIRHKSIFLALTLALAPCAFAQSTPSPDEQTLLQLANQARTAQGLPPLHWDASLARAARAHAAYVVREPGDLEHQYPGEPDLLTRTANTGARFSTISENLARHAQTPAQLHQIWMSTSVHRANILNPQLDAIGIAVIPSQGSLYAVEDFAHTAPAQSNDTIVQHIAQLLQQRGITPAPSNDDAQKTCEMPKGASGTPRLVIQWDGPNPTQLPDVLLKQITTGSYTSAAVGVCAGQQQQPQFTTYHVAVLLY
jgi:Cysteine-rich secretory protein family